MDTRVKNLIEAFKSNGWFFVGSADISSDWWFSDVFHLTSTWRPIDTNLYLTLLTDPQEIKNKVIWCIGVSAIIPNDRHFSYIEKVTLNEIKCKDLVAFVKNINKIVLADK